VAWSVVLPRHSSVHPASRLEEGSRSAESSDGVLQNGDVGRPYVPSRKEFSRWPGIAVLVSTEMKPASTAAVQRRSGGPSGAKRQLCY